MPYEQNPELWQYLLTPSFILYSLTLPFRRAEQGLAACRPARNTCLHT